MLTHNHRSVQLWKPPSRSYAICYVNAKRNLSSQYVTSLVYCVEPLSENITKNRLEVDGKPYICPNRRMDNTITQWLQLHLWD